VKRLSLALSGMFWINPTMVEETMRMVVNKEHFSVRIVNRDVT
jgi:hypothetical protein